MPSIANSSAATKQEIRDVAAMTVFSVLTPNAPSPLIGDDGTWKTANTVATVYTNFVGGYDGQRIVIVINDANTIINFTTSVLIGNGGIDWIPSVGDSVTAVYDGTNWFCQLGGGGASGNYILKDADDTSSGQLAITGAKDGSYIFTGTNTSTTFGSIGVSAIITAEGGRAISTIAAGDASIAGYFSATSANGGNIGVYGRAANTQGMGAKFYNASGVGTTVDIAKGSTAPIEINYGATTILHLDNTGVLEVVGGINRLSTISGIVDVSFSLAPTVGQVLTATGASAASWQGPYILKNADDTSTGQLILTKDSGGVAPVFQVTNTSTDGGTFCIKGISTGSALGNGIYGQSDGSDGIGVQALVTGIDAVGILSIAQGSGFSVGINAIAAGTSSRAVVGTCNSTTGLNYSIWGENASPDGMAGYFENNNGLTTETAVKVAFGTQFMVCSTDTVEKLTISSEGEIVANGGIDTLTTSTGTVNVAASAAPAIGYQLVATSATTATWQISSANYIAANNGVIFSDLPIAGGTNSIAIGDLAEAASEDTISLGTAAYASGQGSIACGTNAQAIAGTLVSVPNNMAWGSDCLAIGDYSSIAVGNNAVSSEVEAFASGNFVEARGVGSVVIGNNISTDTDYEAVFGTENNNIVLNPTTGYIYHTVDSVTSTITGTVYSTNSTSSLYNLPSATVGAKYVFERTISLAYIINPQDTDYFAGSSAGLYKSLDTDGTYMSIECFSAGIWHVTAIFGTVTDE